MIENPFSAVVEQRPRPCGRTRRLGGAPPVAMVRLACTWVVSNAAGVAEILSSAGDPAGASGTE
jgi:hypothetical protein